MERRRVRYAVGSNRQLFLTFWTNSRRLAGLFCTCVLISAAPLSSAVVMVTKHNPNCWLMVKVPQIRLGVLPFSTLHSGDARKGEICCSDVLLSSGCAPAALQLKILTRLFLGPPLGASVALVWRQGVTAAAVMWFFGEGKVDVGATDERSCSSEAGGWMGEEQQEQQLISGRSGG